MRKLWNDEQLKLVVGTHTNMHDVMAALGYKPRVDGSGTSCYTRVKKRIAELGLDVSHWSRRQQDIRVDRLRKPLASIIQGKNVYTSLTALKDRLIREGLLTYVCVGCGLLEWQGKPLTLQLDHIDGNRENNRLTNLRLLCPNCHSQTETFAGGNTRKSGVSTPVVRGPKPMKAFYSNHKGVSYRTDSTNRPWVAYHGYGKERVYLGHFVTEAEAIAAYDASVEGMANERRDLTGLDGR